MTRSPGVMQGSEHIFTGPDTFPYMLAPLCSTIQRGLASFLLNVFLLVFEAVWAYVLIYTKFVCNVYIYSFKCRHISNILFSQPLLVRAN